LSDYRALKIGKKTAEDIAREIVLELTFTAHDMAAFARDLGHVEADGSVKPPFAWDEKKRLELRAKLDALFFILFGITDRSDVRYIYSTFPSVQADEEADYGRYLSRDLCLAWLNAFAAGDPDAAVRLA
jgi:hypothetical protein